MLRANKQLTNFIEKTLNALLNKKTQRKESNKKKQRRLRSTYFVKRLWGGYSSIAIPELESIIRSQDVIEEDKVNALWELFRWHYSRENYHKCLSILDQLDFLDGCLCEKYKKWHLLTLIKTGHDEKSVNVLNNLLARNTVSPEILLLASTVSGGPELSHNGSTSRLDLINNALLRYNIGRIKLIDSNKNLDFHNITSESKYETVYGGDKVSVIVPAYNAENTIATAIHSILNQSWHNIEIIVVDDSSSDATSSVVRSIAAVDSRIKLVRNTSNGGAYSARNRGLRSATGEFVMVHDADDWSHADKILEQVQFINSHAGVVAVLSQWVRVTKDLRIVGPWRPKGSIYDVNLSSLMVRRSVFDQVGEWDEVRVNADAEFVWRLRAYYGKAAVGKITDPPLLSLSLTQDTSLTRMGTTGIQTLSFGPRAQYRDAYRFWHRKIAEGDGAKHSNKLRPFPIPPCIASKEKPTRFDIVFVCDFALKGGAFASTLQYIRAAEAAGLKVAVWHWRKFDLDPVSPINPKLYELATEKRIPTLTSGDLAETDCVIIGYPAILRTLPDAIPDIRTNMVCVIVNQFASRLLSGEDEQYNPIVARENVQRLFGKDGVWIPISHWVHRLMEQDERYPVPYSSPWHPLIDSSTIKVRKNLWRREQRIRPTIGRHGRDAYTKWPTSPDAIMMAYGVEKDWNVQFLGGARFAINKLGYQPDNWRVYGFDEIDISDFLLDLDFFVHYPHEEYIEEFGRAVLEAMAHGIPVILPPQFEETFGGGALYAEPEALGKVIETLWEDQSKYTNRVEAGWKFISENCESASFMRRFIALKKDGSDKGTVRDRWPHVSSM
ncbi:glycosyltransferase [Aquibaculum arenosum]|uniref:Glycosyltransferase n=1 Tax=Aquibaculum arenosum TaxID=3032591 RepID=A0ABT5YHT4_9PROT|nr:glycosyltransferase [Fodinicurvata sp. CAU 1616]MDF2094478.1 glycosyltransferase [Fodinicurvata sp. CAU 1616]